MAGSYDGPAPAVLELALARGALVHERIAGDFLGDAEVEPAIEEYIRRFRTFRDALGLLPVATELVVHSRLLGIAGTIDCIARARRGSGLWIIDWKTGPARPRDLLQVAAYWEIAAEEAGSGGALDGLASKQEILAGTAAVVSLTAEMPRAQYVLGPDRAAFLAAVRLYSWLKQRGR